MKGMWHEAWHGLSGVGRVARAGATPAARITFVDKYA